MNFLMNELPQIRPVLFVQAGNVVSVDVGEFGFRHGSCTHVPSRFLAQSRAMQKFCNRDQNLGTKRSRLAIGDPELVMIDEPTEGLAPTIVQQIGDLIAEIARRGVAILLVEQKLSIAMRISHRVYVMGHGRIVFEGTPDELKANASVRKEWLEV